MLCKSHFIIFISGIWQSAFFVEVMTVLRSLNGGWLWFFQAILTKFLVLGNKDDKQFFNDLSSSCLNPTFSFFHPSEVVSSRQATGRQANFGASVACFELAIRYLR